MAKVNVQMRVSYVNMMIVYRKFLYPDSYRESKVAYAIGTTSLTEKLSRHFLLYLPLWSKFHGNQPFHSLSLNGIFYFLLVGYLSNKYPPFVVNLVGFLSKDQDPACLTLGEQGRYSYFQIKIVWVNKHSLMYMLVKSLTYYCGRLKPIGWIFHLPS